jgi:hypothetical protein
MNLNSLIIAADASRARLFRTAQTNLEQTPVELLEVDAIERGSTTSNKADAGSEPQRKEELRAYVRQIAERGAHFAEYHFCNPIIVSATHGVSPLLVEALEREVPHVYLRSVSGDAASLPTSELLDSLREQEAFTPVRYPAVG